MSGRTTHNGDVGCTDSFPTKNMMYITLGINEKNIILKSFVKKRTDSTYLFKFQQSLNAQNTAICYSMVHAFINPTNEKTLN